MNICDIVTYPISNHMYIYTCCILAYLVPSSDSDDAFLCSCSCTTYYGRPKTESFCGVLKLVVLSVECDHELNARDR